MSEKKEQQDQELKQILAKSKRKWRKLIEIFSSNHSDARISPPTNDDLDTPGSQKSPEPQVRMKGRLKARESEEIYQRVEKLHQDSKMMVRLAKVGKQTRNIIIFIIIFSISAIVFFLIKGFLFH